MSPDPDVERRIEEELDSGEKIVWQGQPKARFFTGPGLVFTLSAPIWIAVFSGFFLQKNHFHFQRLGEMLPVLIVPLAFVLIGITAPLFQYYASLRTHYLLTNRRAMIITLGSTKKVRSYYPDKLQSLERTEKKNGWGNIVIERSVAGGLSRNNTIPQEVGFLNIPDVKTVEGMMRRLAMSGSSKNT